MYGTYTHHQITILWQYGKCTECLVTVVLFFPVQWLALIPYKWNQKHTFLVIISVGRYLLIPLLVLCVSPSPSQPVLPLPSNFIVALVLILIVGLTTGYFGTLPTVLAPKMVPSEHREIVGERT